MDLGRIRKEIADAQREFSYVEPHRTDDDKLYVLAALQTNQNKIYTLSIDIPESYPNTYPRITVRKPDIPKDAPHQYTDGTICYVHPMEWNPGRHSLTTAIMRSAKWLAKYEVWQSTGRWPGVQLKHY